ncbi:MAG TPA: 2-oxoacid:ferredoxin oxidoreductase subunit beta [Bacteroidales bacterium]|nr:2-oxoacid:ferredoxin oxidoreductase subunit beta [Bacteroidales bacterium]HQH18030.1 2-oxoacid:ferredoxin oxidoreductase subunit beta [Bacteroidales bacterium]HQI44716.1 2-oxoacid:ferredoxin oxidoreductase subunit beta [Bacteroidales bacterium]
MEENLTVERSRVPLTKEDFVSDQMVKWCPGCGAHAILSSVANVFPKIGYKKENFMMVSGIGCSSRFPYYVNTYGFHGIHGRANPIATGIKIANPHLSVWVATGDGDSMAIGGNHFIHIIRRNVDLNIMLFNNQIYGLTKGQYSPTTPMGKITKTSPQGTIEHPFNCGELVLGAQGTFFARVVDTNPKLMTEVMFEAAKHDGTSIVEILENCVIFADGTHNDVTAKEVRDDAQIVLKNGEHMIFGKNKDKGIRLNGPHLEVVEIGKNGITENDILIHDQYDQDPGIHLMLAKMAPPLFPMALGVIRSAMFPTYDDMVEEQITFAKANSKIKCVDDLLNSGDTWEIK